MNGQPVVSPVLIDINLDNGGLDPQVLPTPPGGGFNIGLGFHRGHFYGAGPVTGGFELRRIPIAGGAAEQSYKAMLSGLPTAIIDQGNRTGLAGFFDRIGTQPRTGYAELPRAERVFTNGLE
jgi:hypothetical protein